MYLDGFCNNPMNRRLRYCLLRVLVVVMGPPFYPSVIGLLSIVQQTGEGILASNTTALSGCCLGTSFTLSDILSGLILLQV